MGTTYGKALKTKGLRPIEGSTCRTDTNAGRKKGTDKSRDK